ncbi:MAG TPA: hypothetical protein DCX14_08145 [Flavobacteriales bacterium]|nr:hypothetical protein [Flavobacteriales bacterium]
MHNHLYSESMKTSEVRNQKDDKGNDLTFTGRSKMLRSEIEFTDENSTVIIGNDCLLRDAKIKLGTKSRLEVGAGCILDGAISIGAYSTVKIGNNLSVTHALNIRCAESTSVEIGDDCLIASNVVIRTNDGHPIYCTQTGKHINVAADIKIADHVWLADEVKVIKGVRIGEGSIIGANSVVTHSVGKCSLAVGIPSKTVKECVTWEHSKNIRSDRYYDFSIINGIKLPTPNEIVSSTIKQKINDGSYESLEARQLALIMQDGDRLLEIGAGLGYISAYCSKLVELEECTVLEANPKLIPIIRKTHEINGVRSNIHNVVALTKESSHWNSASTEGTVEFHINEDFWESSVSGNPRSLETVHVRAQNIDLVVDNTAPTVIVCDIEGGELDIFESADLSKVRNILMEVHQNIIGLDGVDRITKNLADKGLYYDPNFSVGHVLVYSRI